MSMKLGNHGRTPLPAPKSWERLAEPLTMDQGELIAQFCAVTNAEVDTASQYLESSGYDLETAIGLFFASDGATAAGQADAMDVRDRIEGTTDQLIDPEELAMEEYYREARRANRKARQTRSVFNQGRNEEDLENLTPHERRLARLFRPPFDIIEDIDLEDAKEQAQQLQRWILVNVQDSSEFQCQVLNRDLWSNTEIKEIVSQSFVFLQYDVDSVDGEDYRALYPFEDFPHIAIIDPWTGEQVRNWKTVPKADHFLEQLVDYIGSTDVGAVPNPTTHAHGSTEPPSISVSATESPAPLPEPVQESAQEPVEPFVEAPASAPSHPVDMIEARDVPEPSENATRVQLRTGDGRRVVHKFALEAPVADIYAYVKFAFPDFTRFTLTADRKNLESALEQTVEAANLKNSMILIDSL